ncbi:hypothetical protein QQG74_10930 [Micromonospora sp. FIMYZ51]|uniref:hypothetical protein n=1 Tax=Micromonospora sp. FIMYZ51 TaxID=3051832 RepID=UPI00311F8418
MSAPQRVENPPSEARADTTRTLVVPEWLAITGWAVLVGILAVLLLLYWNGAPYSPDSWRYYELSQTLGGDFFRFSSRHSYQSTEPYAMGCGPLWPVLIGVTAALTRLGAQAGLVAAVGCVLATAATLSALGRRIGVRGLGPIVAVGLLGFPPFLDEVLSARTFPLAVLLLSLLLLALVATDRRPALAWPAAGAAAGGLVLTRPDTLLAISLLAALLIIARRRDWRWFVPAGLVFAIVLVPWAIYGLTHFDTPFPADNRIVAAAVPQLHASHVVDVDQVPTYLDDPLGWLARLARNVPGAVLETVKGLVLAPTVVATAAAGLLLLRRWRLRGAPRWLLLCLAAVAAFTVQVTFSELSTGYLARRYLGLVVLLVLLLAIVLLRRTPMPAALTRPRTGLAVGVLLLMLPAGWAIGYQLVRVPPQPESLTGGAVEQELRRCQNGTTLTIDPATEMTRHSALTGRQTAKFPENFADLSVAQRRDWIATYRIGQLYLPPLPANAEPDAVRRNWEPLLLLAAAARVTPDPCATTGQLYQVSLR